MPGKSSASRGLRVRGARNWRWLFSERARSTQARCWWMENKSGSIRRLLREPGILIIDEPTRGIDVGAKAEIHAMLRGLADEGKAVIVISSDLPEVLAISDRILVMREGRIAGELTGPEASEESIMRYAA